NFGVYASNGGEFSSTGFAKLDITGQGSTAGTANNYGVMLHFDGYIKSLHGDMTVNGTGGGSTTGNHGIALSQWSAISSTGSANVTLTGLEGGGTSRYGLYSNSGSHLLGSSTMSGNLTLITDTMLLSS